MKIQLISTRAIEFSLSENEVSEDSTSLSFSNGYPEESSAQSFTVFFELEVKSVQGFKLSVDYVAVFETEGIVSEEFKRSHFPTLNAPAIVYPYLRSFISTVTLNAGYNAIIIPTVNFQAIANKSKQTEKNS